MFLKCIFKYQKSTGERVVHYRLVESYRINDQVKHETILNLGSLIELPEVEQKKALARRINDLLKQSVTGQSSLFISSCDVVEKMAKMFFNQIRQKQSISQGKEDYHVVDLQTLENKDVKEVGGEWLCLQALEQLHVREFLVSKGWSHAMIQLVLTHVISRAVYPASELKTASWIKENSSVCELTGYPVELITKDKLYNISLKLFAIREELEKHLGKTTNELFDLDDKIIIYDLSNTYYEGVMKNSKIAKFGRSKEKRNDARLVVLAVVINAQGFLKYSRIFEGNLSDVKSLEQIVEELSKRTSSTGRKPVIVMDAGISSETNLKMLRDKGFDYMCVSRGGINKYEIDINTEPVTINDKKNQPISLQRATVEGLTDNFILVNSYAKALKEHSMSGRLTEKFEQAITDAKQSLYKKSGIKKYNRVWERIGRIKQKYQGAGNLYEIETKQDDKGNVTDITWKQKTTIPKEGKYLLRTTLNEKDEKVQWTIYNTIRKIEATFRVLKTDLDLRPIYHKTDEASMAHLHLGLLAYQVVNTIRYQLKQKEINAQWKEIIRIMNTQKMVTTTMVDKYQQTICIRQCSEPTKQLTQIYKALNYKPRPFTRKKFVVPQTEISKIEMQQWRVLNSS